MGYKRGDVLLVPFPYSDLSTTKVRPVVVVSSSIYHKTQPDLMLAAITTNVTAAQGRLDYILKDWKSAGLKFPSAFKPVVFTLDAVRVLHRVGVMHKADLSEIDQRLKDAFGL